VVPPDAVNVTLVPLQTVADGVTDMLGEGSGLTVIVLVAVLVHPFALVAVTVYVVVAVATTVLLAVVCPPGAQL